MSQRLSRCFIFTVLTLVCAFVTLAAQLQSVEGAWVIARNRGDGALMGHHPTAAPHELIDGLLTIRLGAAAATVDTSTGSRVVSRSYQLDALETVQFRARLVKGVLTVHRTEVVQLPAGQATVETIERFSIQADRTLLLERTATTQGRSTTRRQIFERRQ